MTSGGMDDENKAGLMTRGQNEEINTAEYRREQDIIR